jgi:hypothetical protein
VQLLNRLLRHAAIVVVDERKSAGPPRLAIGGNDNLHRLAYRAEMLPDICLGRAVREIANE